MPRRRGKVVVGDFTAHELRMIELRTHGVKTPEAARIMGLKRSNGYTLLWKIFRKAGVDDVALLTRWAIENGLDEPLPPERPEDLPLPVPKQRKRKIKLNRVQGPSRRPWGRSTSG